MRKIITPIRLALIISIGVHLIILNLLPKFTLGKELEEQNHNFVQNVTFRVESVQINADKLGKERKSEENYEVKIKEVKKEVIEEKLPSKEVEDVKKEIAVEENDDSSVKEIIKKVDSKKEREFEEVEDSEESKREVVTRGEELEEDNNRDEVEKIEQEDVNKIDEIEEKQKGIEKKEVELVEEESDKEEQGIRREGKTEKAEELKEIERVDLTKGKIEAGIIKPGIKKYQRPSYPESMRRRKIESKVILMVLLNTSGQVVKVEIKDSSGYQKLDWAAQEAVKGWEFTPTKREGKQIEAWILIPISFKLN